MASLRSRLGLTSLAALCALTGCTVSTGDGPGAASPAPSSPSASEPSTAGPTEPTEPVTLQFLVYGDPATVAAYRDLAAAFTRQRPEVTVRVRAAADPAAALERVRQAGEPSGDSSGDPSSEPSGDPASGPAPDVFVMHHEYLPVLVEEGLVQPVDGLLEERQLDFGDGYHRDGLEAWAEAAALQCMPHDVSPTVVYYNEDLVDLAGVAEEGEEPPSAEDGWTFEEFAAAARDAARQPRAKGVHVDPTVKSLAPFVWSASADIVDDDTDPTRLTLSEDGPLEAVEQVLELLRDPEVTPTWSELQQRSALERFTSGRLGMIVGSRSLVPTLRAAEDLDFDVMPLPSLGVYRTVADMSGYCLAADTEHTAAAADFLAFAVGRQGATLTAAPGDVVPSNLEVAHSSAFAQEGRQPASSFVFTEGVRRSQTLPYTALWEELERRVGPLMRRLFYAPVVDLDTLLSEIDERSSRVLEVPQEPAAEQSEG